MRTWSRDYLAVSFENGRELPNPSDSNLLENIDTFAYCLDRAIVPPSIGEDTTVGSRFGQTEERMDTRSDTKAGK